MKQETKDYIEQVAYSLRASCNVPTPIRDIETLIENIAGTLEPANTKTVIQMGKVKKEGNKFAIRYMDKIEIQKEINWVVAVTIGHLVLHLQDGNPYEFHMIDTRPYNVEGDTFFKAAKEYVESQISGGITSSGKLLGEVDGSNVYTYGTPLNYFNIKIVGTPEGEKIGLKTQTSYCVE